MSTLNPRVTITLQPATAAQIRKLSALTGDSQSAIIAQLLEASAPVFTGVIRTLEAAQEAKTTLSDKVRSDLAEAQAKIEGQLGLALETFDAVTVDLVREAEIVQRRGRKTGRATAPAGGLRAPVEAVPTPLCNTGVRSGSRRAK